MKTHPALAIIDIHDNLTWREIHRTLDDIQSDLLNGKIDFIAFHFINTCFFTPDRVLNDPAILMRLPNTLTALFVINPRPDAGLIDDITSKYKWEDRDKPIIFLDHVDEIEPCIHALCCTYV